MESQRRKTIVSGAVASAVAVVALLLIYRSWNPGGRVQEAVFAGKTQGTTYSIKIASLPLNDERKRLIETMIQRRLEAIDREMSLYRDDSELVMFNRKQTTEPVPISSELMAVFQAARAISEASNGAFDVTVAPLVAAWGFGPSKRKDGQPPSESEIAAALQRVGYGKLELNLSAGTIRKAQPDITCDLNGIAQGFTVDRLADDLSALGYSNYVVEIGGEIKARGRNAKGACWRAAIEQPAERSDGFERLLPLENMALTTAGDYRNFAVKDGVRLSHLLDPLTGCPITHNLASVSVLHTECAMADGYDTALMVLGPDNGYRLAVEKGVAAMFICRDPQQGFEVRTTPAFDALVHPNKP